MDTNQIPVSEIPSISKKQTYTSGRKIPDNAVLGVDVLFGLLFEQKSDIELDLKLVWYHPDEIAVVYDYDTPAGEALNPKLPRLKLIV